MSNWNRPAAMPAAVFGAVLVGLGGCDVQVHDETPTVYPVNHEAGMYEVKADVNRDTLVSPGTVLLFEVDGKQRLPLSPDSTQTAWHAFYSVRCRSSFPLQFLAVWRVQGLTMKQKLVPPQPRQVQLTPPPLTREVKVDTTAKSTKGWDGAVPYRFVTAEHTEITGAHVDPVSQDPADVAAAKAITVDSPFPVDAPCAVPTEIRLTSKLQRAQGNLVIDTDMPAFPHWTTKVEFAPK